MPPAAGTGRAKQQAKRRNDDAPYQRGGAVADVDQRAKRRKLDITGNNVSAGGYTTAGKRGAAGTGSSDEGVLIQLDLTKLPTEAIYKYLERHDLLPQIVPSPLSNDRPPPPNQLIISKQSAAHNPYYPNYTRPPPQQQQRSSVLSDEEGLDTTALCDTDIRTPLANLAQAHWVKTTQINENAIINSFCQALRVKVQDSQIMPKGDSSSGSTGKDYTVTSSGTNSEGNHYCSRDYGSSAPNDNSYHYSNTDGSYYYSNPDGSTYYNSGSGYSNYTSPSGESYKSGGN